MNNYSSLFTNAMNKTVLVKIIQGQENASKSVSYSILT